MELNFFLSEAFSGKNYEPGFPWQHQREAGIGNGIKAEERGNSTRQSIYPEQDPVAPATF